MYGVIWRFPCFARIIFPAANYSIPFAASHLFGSLTEWDGTNEDHRTAICFRVGRMHWQPAERQHAYGSCVRYYSHYAQRRLSGI
jgi:hypothetical protein